MNPTPKKPKIIMAYVDGSGAADGRRRGDFKAKSERLTGIDDLKIKGIQSVIGDKRKDMELRKVGGGVAR
jgi:hypothetical protein